MAVNPIPEKVVNYNVYDETDKLIGLSSEVSLPNLEAMTETISGAGIAGEYESPTPGHFGSISIEIPFRVIYDTSFKLMTKGRTLVLRASQQSYDVAGGSVEFRPLKITLKTIPKGIDLGTIAPGKTTETKNTFEIVYIKIEENRKTLLELDKLNFVYIVNGVDILGPVRNQI